MTDFIPLYTDGANVPDTIATIDDSALGGVIDSYIQLLGTQFLGKMLMTDVVLKKAK